MTYQEIKTEYTNLQDQQSRLAWSWKYACRYEGSSNLNKAEIKKMMKENNERRISLMDLISDTIR